MSGSCQADSGLPKPSLSTKESVAGILNLDKPKELTSHDVVARVRRLVGHRQVGHAGTLDPMATGVLVVCLGKATRLIEYLADHRKIYRATVRFGTVTDTWDAEGQVVESHNSDEVTLEVIERALPSFRGVIEQTPPMYSALKRGGQPLYKLARKGLTVEREPRRVEIHDLRIMDWRPPELFLWIECSKGTYVRALAYDLGRAVGVGGYLSALTRLAVGGFRLEEAISLEALEAGNPSGLWQRHILPLQAALGNMPGCTITDESTIQRISRGQEVALDLPEGAQLGYACDGEQRLLAILKRRNQDGLWQPDKVLI